MTAYRVVIDKAEVQPGERGVVVGAGRINLDKNLTIFYARLTTGRMWAIKFNRGLDWRLNSNQK